jgi:hypothetical protein
MNKLFYYVRVNPKPDKDKVEGTMEEAIKLRDLLQGMGYYVEIKNERRLV